MTPVKHPRDNDDAEHDPGQQREYLGATEQFPFVARPESARQSTKQR